MPYQVQEMTDRQMLDLLREWKYLSRVVSVGRAKEKIDEANEVLRYWMQETEHPLAKFAAYWLGDNLLRQGAHDEAIQAYQHVVDTHGHVVFAGRPWGGHALERMATAHLRAGRPNEAIETHLQLLERFPQGVPLGAHFCRIARIGEENDIMAAAEEYYNQVLGLPGVDLAPMPGSMPPAIEARCRLATIESGAPWARRELPDAIQVVAQALGLGDDAALRQLANPAFMHLGRGAGELVPVETEAFLAQLINDLGQSSVSVNIEPLWEEGSHKARVRSEGWSGQLLQGDVYLLFSYEAFEGWSWSGIVLSGTPDREALRPFVPEAEGPALSEVPITGLETSSLKFKAPWKKGLHFRAGGGVWSGLMLLHPLGPFTWWIESFSACGFGLMGWYYGEWSHTRPRSDYYAIDFTRFQQGLPNLQRTRGCQVLNIADGMVEGCEDSYNNGDARNANYAIIRHSPWSKEVTYGAALIVAIAYLCGDEELATTYRRGLRYSSDYWHLEGGTKGNVPVSKGQWAPQGQVLGTMDDTGYSAFDHLHFCIHDRENGGRSVMPSPMDGQTLLPGDDHKCVSSTNVPRP